VLVRALLLLLAICASYLVVINALLFTGGLAGLISAKTPVVRLDTGTSYSLWPGHFALRNMRLEVADSNVHLVVEVPRGSVRVALRDLLHQHFSATGVRGDDYLIWVRPNARGQRPERTEPLPPLSDAPQREPPTPTDELWSVSLDDVDVGLRELWGADLRYQGAAAVNGGFSLQPRVRTRVGPMTLTFSGGTLHRGDRPLASALRASIHASTPEVEIAAISPDWRDVSAEVSLHAQLDDAAPIGAYFPRLAGLRDGKGPLELRASLRKGQLVGDTRVKYHSEHLRYEHPLFDAEGALYFSAEAPAQDKTVLARLDVPSSTFRTRSKAELEVEKVVIAARLGRNVATPALEHLKTSGNVVSLNAMTLVDLGVIPKDLRVFGGTVSGDFAAETKGMGISTEVRAALSNVRVGAAEWRIGITGRASGIWTAPLDKLTSGELANGLLDIRDLDVARAGRDVNDWRLRIGFPKLTARADPLLVSGGFEASAAELRPALRLAGVTLPRLVDQILGPQSLHVIGRTSVTATQQDVTIDRPVGDSFDVVGRVVHLDRGTYGAFLFRVSPFSLGAHLAPDDSGVSLFAGQNWLQKQLAALPK
jgi:hypothetical protein